MLDQVAEGDLVVSRLRIHGTQHGPYFGMPPTGRSATWTAVGIDRFRGDKVVERTALFDVTDVMRQLGHRTLTLPPVSY